MRPGEADDAAVPELRSLLARLDADEDRAGAEFERLRRALTKFFDWRGAAWPEECADETLDRLARKIGEGVAVLDVAGFAHGIARLVLQESRRADARLSPLDGVEPSVSPDTERTESDGLVRALDRCLETLPRDSRELVLAYYAGAHGRSKIEARQRLARELRLTDNALRSRVQRLRERLEDCVRHGRDLRGPDERHGSGPDVTSR